MGAGVSGVLQISGEPPVPSKPEELCRQLELSELLKDPQELRSRSQAHGSMRVKEGQPNLIFAAIGCQPLGVSTAFFSINCVRCLLIVSVWAFMQRLVGGKFLLRDIFVHVSFAHLPPCKAKPLFYVSEPSRSDCQSPGLA